MEKLTEELRVLLQLPNSPAQKEASKIYLGTLLWLTLNIFDWLPPEQQSEILTTCGTWFDMGLLMGRSPNRLVDILARVNPRIIETEIPDWVIRSAEASGFE